MNSNCYFCEENRFALNKAVGLPTFDAIVYEDANVFVTPDIAPVCRGHFLVVSKKHVNSFGNTSDDTLKSLLKAAYYIKNNYFESMEMIMIEHGAVIPSSAGASIDHAHIHLIPNTLGIDLQQIEDFIYKNSSITAPKEQASMEVLKMYAKKNQPYLYFAFYPQVGWCIPATKITSQFFRSFITSFSSREYDWKKTYFSDESKNLFFETLKMKEV